MNRIIVRRDIDGGYHVTIPDTYRFLPYQASGWIQVASIEDGIPNEEIFDQIAKAAQRRDRNEISRPDDAREPRSVIWTEFGICSGIGKFPVAPSFVPNLRIAEHEAHNLPYPFWKRDTSLTICIAALPRVVAARGARLSDGGELIDVPSEATA